jgi:hypothetical protein
MYDYPPEYDAPAGCAVCGESVDTCECPECPECGECGNPKCFGTHVSPLPQRYTYTVVWHSAHACDDLGTFDSEQEAKDAGDNWLIDQGLVRLDEDEDEVCYEIIVSGNEFSSPKDVREAIETPLSSEMRAMFDSLSTIQDWR